MRHLQEKEQQWKEHVAALAAEREAAMKERAVRLRDFRVSVRYGRRPVILKDVPLPELISRVHRHVGILSRQTNHD